ncbi:hypothetical protein ACSS6W_003443 [Trichoderma asperelloides]
MTEVEMYTSVADIALDHLIARCLLTLHSSCYMLGEIKYLDGLQNRRGTY